VEGVRGCDTQLEEERMSWLSEFFGRLFAPRQSLNQMANSRGELLDYDNSVVDLLKTLGKDSSYDARKDLAEEYGRPEYRGTAEDNMWLHREIMKRR
jgi:hypothetical protein